MSGPTRHRVSLPTSLRDRFWKKTSYDADTGCWNWTASLTPEGYALYWLGGRYHLGHRVAYAALHGPIVGCLVIDHRCRNRCCVNPLHMEAVTNATNILRGQSPPALNARRTHCIRGHLLAGPNLYLNAGGWRVCRTCRRDRKRAATARRKASA
jgi:hypothetical protein